MSNHLSGTSGTDPSGQCAVTGLGVISGAGSSLAETKAFLQPGFRPTTISAECVIRVPIQENWFSHFAVSKETLPANMLALVAVQEALESANYNREELQALRVGVCLGSTVGCSNYQEAFIREYVLDQRPAPKPVFAAFNSNTAQFISRYFGLRGPSQMISNACTSGADAIGVAASWLRADLCDVVICGGTELALTSTYYGFKSMLLCSPQLCQPFDKNRQGLTLGDGAGILILEKLNTKKRVKAKLLGVGLASDAFHPTAPHPEARGLRRAAEIALTQAGGGKAIDVDFINTHGTATPHNDLAEGKWIAQHAPNSIVVATKAYTGHTLGAAGAIEAVFTVLSLLEQKLPPSRGFREIDPQIGFAPTTEVVVAVKPWTTALSLSLGFGGTNAAVCFGVADAT